jgi:hypothetical protein
MDEMEDKIGAILGNPQMMQQIMHMAQSLGNQQPKPEPPNTATIPQVDVALVQKIAGLAQQSGIDRREEALLGALEAYLTGDRVARLERAMRAAKMAKLATSVLGQQGFLSGR